ncbi:MAG: DUF58 domain-containing protein [Verrucomicrobiota bacterium]
MPTAFLQPKTYQAFRNMELLARSVVDGFITGLHRSPFKGFALEFAEHRQYVPGDDLRHLDWKLLGKLNRYYVKQYEEDTSLRAYLVVDTSGSMGYADGQLSKLDYARYTAAVLSYLLLQQKDSVGLAICNRELETFLPPRSTRTHFRLLINTLQEAGHGDETKLADVLHHLALRIKRRALIIIISDLFDDPDKISLALNHFAHKKHEIIILRTLANREKTFTFNSPTRFEGLESNDFREIDPRIIRKEYLRQFEEHRNKIRETCFARRIDYTEFLTDQPFEKTIARYLVERMKR